MEDEKEVISGGNGEDQGENNVEEEITFGFPIVDHDSIVQMKNISPSVLLHFNGKNHIFYFDILCKSYDYSYDV